MKARTKSTRWLLLILLVGLMAAAGLALTHHHANPTVAKLNAVVAPAHIAPPETTLVASAGTPHRVTPRFYGIAASSYSDGQLSDPITNHSDSHSDASSGSGAAWGSHAAGQTDDSVGAPPPQNHPAPTDTHQVPPAGSGEYAYQGYAPLGCEVPAGCGAVGSTGYVTRQTTATSGGLGLPAVHNTSGNDDSTPPTVSAPELDAGALAGAVTLLLGALAILRGRRPARVKR